MKLEAIQLQTYPHSFLDFQSVMINLAQRETFLSSNWLHE
jgi:hypothetical protein